MKIVKFKDGKFGIRRFNLFFGYEYLDLNHDDAQYWWTRGDIFFNDCKKDLPTCQKKYNQLKDKGKIYKGEQKLC